MGINRKIQNLYRMSIEQDTDERIRETIEENQKVIKMEDTGHPNFPRAQAHARLMVELANAELMRRDMGIIQDANEEDTDSTCGK